MGKIVKYVVIMAMVAPLFALTYFESSNGWGLPGDNGKISLIYGSVDGWSTAFQMMICFDPAVWRRSCFDPFRYSLGRRRPRLFHVRNQQ